MNYAQISEKIAKLTAEKEAVQERSWKSVAALCDKLSARRSYLGFAVSQVLDNGNLDFLLKIRRKRGELREWANSCRHNYYPVPKEASEKDLNWLVAWLERARAVYEDEEKCEKECAKIVAKITALEEERAAIPGGAEGLFA